MIFLLEQVLDRYPLVFSPLTPLSEVIGYMGSAGAEFGLVLQAQRLYGVIHSQDILQWLAEQRSLDLPCIELVARLLGVSLNVEAVPDLEILLDWMNRAEIEVLPILEHGHVLGVVTLKRLQQFLLSGMKKHLAYLEIQQSERLHQSETRFRSIFNQAAVGIVQNSLRGQFLLVNQKFADIVQYTQQELLQLNFQEITHPDDLPTNLHKLQQLLQGEISTFSQEKRYVRKDDVPIWVNLTVSLVRDSDGYPDSVIAVVEDIQERKEAELALREKEERYRTLAQNFPNGSVQTFDQELRYTFISGQLLLKAGVQPEQMIGKSLAEVLSPESFAIAEPYFQAALTGQSSSFELELGSYSFFISLTPIYCSKTGEICEVLAVNQDITDRKHTAARLQESEQFLRSIYDGLAASIFVFDVTPEQNFRFVGWNRFTEEYIGILASDNVGKLVTEMFPRELSQQMLSNYRRCVVEGQSISYEEFLNYAGKEMWGLTTLTPLRDLQGRIYRIVGYSTNINALKKAEAELQQLNEQLEQRVIDRTRELQVLNSELAHTTRLKDEFLANMTHELRTPLNSILGLSEILQEEIFGSLNDKQRQFLGTIHSSGDHLLSLINDILDLAKIEAGRLELQLSMVSVQSLGETCLVLVQPQANRKKIELQLYLDESVRDRQKLNPLHQTLDIEVDERRIRQVLINLLGNAIKFTSEGGRVGLTISLKTYVKRYDENTGHFEMVDFVPDGHNFIVQNSENTAHFSHHLGSSSPHSSPHSSSHSSPHIGDEPCDYVVFAVHDTGIGIAPHEMGRLFQAFVQLDSSLARRYEGTGLGLVLVKQITELHKGFVTVESEVGQGSQFSVAIPWRGKRPQSPMVPSGNYGSSSPIYCLPAAPSILILANLSDQVTTMSNYLQAKGWRIIATSQLEDAIAQVVLETPVVVILDVLPDPYQGLQTVIALRNDPNLMTIPLLLLSEKLDPSLEAAYRSAGISHILDYPLRLQHLVEHIHTCLTSHDRSSL